MTRSALHEKVVNRRNNFVHQLSSKLVFKNHEASFAIEDLHIKGMIRNRKLSRAIADCGWRRFIQALTYTRNVSFLGVRITSCGDLAAIFSQKILEILQVFLRFFVKKSRQSLAICYPNT